MKKTYKISGLDCPSCAALLESDFEDAGLKCRCNYPKSTLEVEFTNGVSETQIFSLVEKSGYKLLYE